MEKRYVVCPKCDNFDFIPWFPGMKFSYCSSCGTKIKLNENGVPDYNSTTSNNTSFTRQTYNESYQQTGSNRSNQTSHSTNFAPHSYTENNSDDNNDDYTYVPKKSRFVSILITVLKFIGNAVVSIFTFFGKAVFYIVKYTILAILRIIEFIFLLPFVDFRAFVIIVATFFLLNLSIKGMIKYVNKSHEKNGDIQISYSSSYFKDKNCDHVVQLLEENGFTNIQLVPLNDLKGKSPKQNTVASIQINETKKFKMGKYFAPDAPIYVYYHSYQNVATTTSRAFIIEYEKHQYTTKKARIIPRLFYFPKTLYI